MKKIKNKNNKRKYQIGFSILLVTILLSFTLSTPLQVYAVCPQGRIVQAMAYDSTNDVIIFYGGTTDTNSAYWTFETWVYDYNNNAWTNMNPSIKPVRYAHQMAYDEESDLVILFGGINNSQNDVPYNEIFTYDYNSNNWTLMTSEPCPTSFNFIFPIISLFSILAAIVILRRYNKNG